MGMDVNSEEAADWSRLMKENSSLEHECARLRAENERLMALIKRHHVTWKRLHSREYTGPLRDDTRAALAADGKVP